MYKKLLLTTLFFFTPQITCYITYVETHNYVYTTPLSMSLVMGHLNSFLQEIKYYNDEDMYFALEEFIRLRAINRREYNSPSIKRVLSHYHKTLPRRINKITNQIKYQYPLDYEALAKGIAYISIGTALNMLAYNHINKFDQNSAFITIFGGAFGFLLSITSIPHLKNALNPNRENEYLEKYQKLFNFVRKLKKRNYPQDSFSYFW